MMQGVEPHLFRPWPNLALTSHGPGVMGGVDPHPQRPFSDLQRPLHQKANPLPAATGPRPEGPAQPSSGVSDMQQTS